MPVSLFPLLMPFTPFHHFPLGSDKEELALVTLFSTPPFSPPVSVSCFSLLPSILSLFPLFPPYVSVPFPLFIWPFFPSFHPHSSVWSTVLSPAKHSCSLPVTGQKKADIQLCMSYYWRLMWENTVQGLTRWKRNIAALKPISFPPVEFVTSETFF